MYFLSAATVLIKEAPKTHKVDARLSLPTKELVVLSILFLLLHFDSS